MQLIFALVGFNFENSDGEEGKIFSSMGGHLLNSDFDKGGSCTLERNRFTVKKSDPF